jgi:MbtH protein
MSELTYRVVVNDEEQYSVWAGDRPAPAGWHDAGFAGSKEECLAHVESVWDDMRPRSLREEMETMR